MCIFAVVKSEPMEKNIHKNRLRVILAEKVITNKWLAEQLGVTCMTVSRWTTNKCQPSLSQCVDIAQLIGVRLCDLVEDYSEQ